MAQNENEQPKKLIIDEDWKVQAQKDKEKLETQPENEPESNAQGRQMPPAEFISLVSMLATQSLFAMGLISEHKDQHPEPDLAFAKYNIDLLGMLEEKTKGNLNSEEQEMISTTLQQLRMAFVQIAKQMQK